LQKHDAIKREVGVLRQLVEKSGTQEDEEFGAAGGTSDDDDARSIRTRLRSRSSSRMKMRRRGGHGGWSLADHELLSL